METQNKGQNRRHIVLATGIAIIAGFAAIAAVVSTAIVFLTYLQVGSPTPAWVFGVLLLACGFGFVCAFLVGRYAHANFKNLGNGNLTGTTMTPGVRSLLIAHAAPLAILLLQLWLLAPICETTFDSPGGRFPWHTDVMFRISYWMRCYWFLAVPSIAALLWADVRVYLRLHRRGNKSAALVWFWGIFCFVLSIAILTLVAFFLPIFKMGETRTP
ncbi:MAG: hypothetical protein WCN95_06775 [bacterium]